MAESDGIKRRVLGALVPPVAVLVLDSQVLAEAVRRMLQFDPVGGAIKLMPQSEN